MCLDTVEIVAYRQELDLRQGVLRRTVRFRDPQGRLTRWQERRLVSMAQPSGRARRRGHRRELAAPGGALCPGRQRDQPGRAALPALASRHLRRWKWASRTPRPCCCAAGPRSPAAHGRSGPDPSLSPGPPGQRGAAARPPDGCHRPRAACPMQPGASITVENSWPSHLARSGHCGAGPRRHADLREAGRFDDLLAAHALAWAHLWEACDVAIEEKQPAATAPAAGLHFPSSLQTVSPHTIEFDIGARPRLAR